MICNSFFFILQIDVSTDDDLGISFPQDEVVVQTEVAAYTYQHGIKILNGCM